LYFQHPEKTREMKETKLREMGEEIVMKKLPLMAHYLAIWNSVLTDHVFEYKA
jgi:hypothetical protein